MALFLPAFGALIRDEGRHFVDHPLDRGGATKFGVTQATLASWRKHAVTAKDVAQMTMAEARDIYLVFYWAPLRMAEVKSQAVATAIFSLGALCGVHHGSVIAQRAASAAVDGRIGAETLAVINAADPAAYLRALEQAAGDYFAAVVAAHPEQSKFLRGWLSRLHRLCTPPSDAIA